jgi:hypothetical protein
MDWQVVAGVFVYLSVPTAVRVRRVMSLLKQMTVVPRRETIRTIADGSFLEALHAAVMGPLADTLYVFVVTDLDDAALRVPLDASIADATEVRRMFDGDLDLTAITDAARLVTDASFDFASVPVVLDDYAALNPDLDAHGDLGHHWVLHGRRESRRQASPLALAKVPRAKARGCVAWIRTTAFQSFFLACPDARHAPNADAEDVFAAAARHGTCFDAAAIDGSRPVRASYLLGVPSCRSTAESSLSSPQPRLPGVLAVTVIVPCYNDGALLAEQMTRLACIRRTCTVPFCVTVVDDGSTDATTQRVVSHAARSYDWVTVVQLKTNRGVSHARNVAVQRATTPYVFMLDCDNPVTGDYLRLAVAALDARPQAAVAYAWPDTVGWQDRTTPFRLDVTSAQAVAEMWTRNLVDNCALVRTAAVVQAGGYDTDLALCEDWDLWLRLVSAGWEFVLLPETGLWSYTVRPDSATRQLEPTKNAVLGRVWCKNRHGILSHLLRRTSSRPRLCASVSVGSLAVLQTMTNYLRRAQAHGADLLFAVIEGDSTFAAYDAAEARAYIAATYGTEAEGVAVVGTVNGGLDLGLSFAVMRHLAAKHAACPYDVMLRLQTKTDDAWRTAALDALLGSDATLRRTLMVHLMSPWVAQQGLASYVVSAWNDNRVSYPIVRALARRFGVPLIEKPSTTLLAHPPQWECHMRRHAANADLAALRLTSVSALDHWTAHGRREHRHHSSVAWVDFHSRFCSGTMFSVRFPLFWRFFVTEERGLLDKLPMTLERYPGTGGACIELDLKVPSQTHSWERLLGFLVAKYGGVVAGIWPVDY